jgi:hypothetical protein
MGALEREGYLTKWAGYVKGWRRRYFVLESPGVLVYYDGKPRGRKKKSARKRYLGAIVLDGSTTCRPVPRSSRRFTVDTTKGTFYFRATQPEDRARWMSSILEAKSLAMDSTAQGSGGSDGFLSSVLRDFFFFFFFFLVREGFFFFFFCSFLPPTLLPIRRQVATAPPSLVCNIRH